jgi:hypothetical protein
MELALLAKVTAVISRDSGHYKREITLDLNSKVQKYFEGNVLHNGKTLDLQLTWIEQGVKNGDTIDIPT